MESGQWRDGPSADSLNLSKLELAGFTKSNLNSLRIMGLGFGEEWNRHVRFTGHKREISTGTDVGHESGRNRVLAVRA